MSSGTTPQQEAAVFTDMVEKYINQFAGDANVGRKVEAAIIDLEVQHTKHVNAVKREFNADLVKLEEAQKVNLDILKEREEQHEKEHKKRLHDITEDYRKQLTQSSDNYQKELHALKQRYENMLAEQAHRAKTVTEVRELSEKEIKRTREEYERIVDQKEKDIAALNRRLEGMFTSATTELTETDSRCRMIEEDNAQLRKDVTFLQLGLKQKNETMGDLLKRSLDDHERVLALCKKLVGEVEGSAAQGEVELSQMRAVLIGNNYEKIRAKIREDEVKAKEEGSRSRGAAEDAMGASNIFTPSSLNKAIDEMEAKDMDAKRKLEELLDCMQEQRRAQKAAIALFEKRIDEEQAKTREHYKKQQEELEQERQKLEDGKEGGDIVISFKDVDGQVKDMRLRRARRASSTMSMNSTASRNGAGGSSSRVAPTAANQGDSPAARRVSLDSPSHS